MVNRVVDEAMNKFANF